MSPTPSEKNPITGALLRRKIRLEQTKRSNTGGAFTKHHTFLSHGDPECPEIRQPQMFQPKEIRALRQTFNMKVKEFGLLVGVHGDTIKKYEAALRIPSYATLRVMQLLRTNPQFIKVLPATSYFNQDKIYLTRINLNVSQSVFARILGVETSTLRGWEISKRKPSGPSVTLLQLAYSFPNQFVCAIIQNEAQDIDESERINDVNVFSGEVQTQHKNLDE
ncbi:MAG: DNA-binding transcriptional regulator YiaG [Lentimonas sp.]|jgi:DNA-binding transcriptional regulator YiaG